MIHKRFHVWSLLALAAAGSTVQPAFGQTTKCYPDYRIGVNFDDQVQTPAVVTTAMSKIAGADLGMVRLVAFWKGMEQTQGVIDFTYLDARVNAARAANLEVLLTFYGIPNWANGSSPSCDFWQGQCSAIPTNSNFFANFASAVAAHYASQVNYYEIWNEPDFGSPPVFWNGSMSDLHTYIAQPGAAAIRAADPGATIVGPAILSSKTKLQSFLSLACSYIDVVTVHSYEGSEAAMKTSLANKWTSAMNTVGCVKPLWVTEFGINSTTVGEPTQANEYGQAAFDLLNGTLGAARVFYYRLEDHGAPSTLHYGLTGPAPTYVAKPSYSSVRDSIPYPDYCRIVYP